MYLLFSLYSRKRLLGAGQTTGQEDFCGIADDIVAFAASSRTRSTQRRVAWQRFAANCRTGLPFSRCSAMHCVTSKVSLWMSHNMASSFAVPGGRRACMPACFQGTSCTCLSCRSHTSHLLGAATVGLWLRRADSGEEEQQSPRKLCPYRFPCNRLKLFILPSPRTLTCYLTDAVIMEAMQQYQLRRWKVRTAGLPLWCGRENIPVIFWHQVKYAQPLNVAAAFRNVPSGFADAASTSFSRLSSTWPKISKSVTLNSSRARWIAMAALRTGLQTQDLKKLFVLASNGMGFCALRRLPGRASFQPCKRYSQFRIDFFRWSFWPALVSIFVASQTAVASGWLPACRTLASSRAWTSMTQFLLIQRLSFWLVSMIFFSWFSTLHIVRSLTSISPHRMFPRVFQEEKGASLTAASNSTLRARQSLFLAQSQNLAIWWNLELNQIL